MSLSNYKSMNECPFCGSTDSSPYISFESITWKKCASCKMGWQDPYLSELNRESYEPFDEIYQRYFQFKDVFGKMAEEKARWIAGRLASSCAVIELGAGLGCLGIELKKINPSLPYVAIEPNAQFAQALRENGVEVESYDPKMATIKVIKRFSEQAIPVAIIMDNLLEHVEDPRTLLSEIHTHALKGSMVFIEVPNEAGLKWRFHLQNALRGSIKAPTFPGHINLFVQSSLCWLLSQCGLTEIRIRGTGIRNETQIHYLSQSRTLTPQLKLIIKLLNFLPIDRLFGLAYWLRAEAKIGSVAS